MRQIPAEVIEEALTLLEQGVITLENGQRRFGEQWPALRSLLAISQRVNQAANPPLLSQRAFIPLDKTAGWQALQLQIERTPQLPALTPVGTARRSRFNPLEWLAENLVRRWGRPLAGAMLTAAVFFLLSGTINAAQPGDPFYRAKLGWDHLGELTSLTANERAGAALDFADRRLVEMELLAARNLPQQVEEAQGYFLRGLNNGLEQAASDNFSEFGVVYARLNEQHDRLAQLQRGQYSFGPRSQYDVLLNRLNSGVNSLAPRVPGNSTPAPTPVPTVGG